jgi:DNA-binding NarL/FixJ family response regulator
MNEHTPTPAPAPTPTPAPAPVPVRVLIADDHAAIRAGLRLMLDVDGIEVVGEAADGATAVRNARLLRPHVVLMDIRMPGMDGIEATRAITHEASAEVLILTTFDLDDYVHGALLAGAVGFLLKSTTANALVDAVRRVAAGDGVLAPEVTRSLIRAFADGAGRGEVAPRHPPIKALGELTARERDVLACLGQGQSNLGIARSLGISESTAKTHVSRLLAKLEVTSRMQAAVVAREAGLDRIP